MVGDPEKDEEKLKDGSVTGLTDIVRWTDKLLVEPLPYIVPLCCRSRKFYNQLTNSSGDKHLSILGS